MDMTGQDDASRGNERSEEVDDQFRALMEGLRTTIPGVMVVFSFLLVLPFQSQFLELSTANSVVYYVAFGSASASAILLIAPSVHQRVRAPISGIRRHSISHVMTATRLAIVGTALFSLTIVAAVYLVSALVGGGLFATLAAALTVAMVSWAWFYLPLVRFRQEGKQQV